MFALLDKGSVWPRELIIPLARSLSKGEPLMVPFGCAQGRLSAHHERRVDNDLKPTHYVLSS